MPARARAVSRASSAAGPRSSNKCTSWKQFATATFRGRGERARDSRVRVTKRVLLRHFCFGVHARSQKRSHGDETPFSKLLPLLGDRGGLFVASDGHSAWLQQELYAAARARNVSVVELGLPPGAVGALAENYALSECDRLVPTRRSSFFRLAAVRSKRPHVRAVWACPATELQARAMASSGATVESCNVMAQCPAPGGRYTYRRRRLGAFGEARRAPL